MVFFLFLHHFFACFTTFFPRFFLTFFTLFSSAASEQSRGLLPIFAGYFVLQLELSRNRKPVIETQV